MKSKYHTLTNVCNINTRSHTNAQTAHPIPSAGKMHTSAPTFFFFGGGGGRREGGYRGLVLY